jgi:hypothetical protein
MVGATFPPATPIRNVILQTFSGFCCCRHDGVPRRLVWNLVGKPFSERDWFQLVSGEKQFEFWLE